MSNNNSIGVFDSGVGGLTIWKGLKDLLPNESFIYFGDSKNCPYGLKSKSEIIGLSKKICDFLISQNCKMIVVACNTATASAIEELRTIYSIPIIGMEPAVKPAAQNTVSGKIGILATQGTINGRLFKETSGKYAKDIEMVVQVGNGLVEIVEENRINSVEACTLLKKYIEPMIEANVDYIVLGCTHYPLLSEQINKITDSKIKLLETSEAVAKQARKVLLELNLEANTNISHSKFYTSGDIEILKKVLILIDSNQNNIEKMVL